ncbi:MAG: dihydrofolate reductase family protein [Armatimonadetes bacterium]|nr:dihydrofolate reductase family protein [Anaerolineae bacterium]
MHVTLDGLVAGPKGEMDWITYNEEIAADGYSLHATTDAAIYGRVTYEMMAAYWPTVLSKPDSDPIDRRHAVWLETASKVVATRSPLNVEWTGTVVIGADIAADMAVLKAQPGKDMWLLGSPTLAQTFMRLDLIDEYHLNVNPVILGRGKPLFSDLEMPRRLSLVESKSFKGGVIGLRYLPIR